MTTTSTLVINHIGRIVVEPWFIWSISAQPRRPRPCPPAAATLCAAVVGYLLKYFRALFRWGGAQAQGLTRVTIVTRL